MKVAYQPDQGTDCQQTQQTPHLMRGVDDAGEEKMLIQEGTQRESVPEGALEMYMSSSLNTCWQNFTL
jgi:hypothetical protein